MNNVKIFKRKFLKEDSMLNVEDADKKYFEYINTIEKIEWFIANTEEFENIYNITKDHFEIYHAFNWLEHFDTFFQQSEERVYICFNILSCEHEMPYHIFNSFQELEIRLNDRIMHILANLVKEAFDNNNDLQELYKINFTY